MEKEMLALVNLKEGKLDIDWEKLEQPNQTIVFYMGLVSINIICNELINNGMDKKTPCALVQQGTTNTQKEFISVLKDMPALVEAKKPKAPTIFIIGGVVSLRDKLKWYTTNAED